MGPDPLLSSECREPTVLHSAAYSRSIVHKMKPIMKAGRDFFSFGPGGIEATVKSRHVAGTFLDAAGRRLGLDEAANGMDCRQAVFSTMARPARVNIWVGPC